MLALIKKYKPIINKNICSLINNLGVINQSLCARYKATIIMITISKAPNLVIKLPKLFFKKPPKIKRIPAVNSDIATNEANVSENPK